MTERYENREDYLGSRRASPKLPAAWLVLLPLALAGMIGLLVGGATNPDGTIRTERPLAGEGVPTAVTPDAAQEKDIRRFRPRPARHTAGRSGRPRPGAGASLAARSGTGWAARSGAGPALSPSTPRTVEVASPGSGCAAALAWLSTHAAPGFRFECPGYALGHQAMTCVNVAGVCPSERLIAIADACPAAYMNEAHNSWILAGLATGRIDPYGYCPD
jgi:hypothetical protein